MPKTIKKFLKRDEWTKTGFILAGIGAAVGLGNIWRFPYMVGSNGGGAFLIPYIAGVVIFGLPLMFLELAIGRKFKGSVITTLKKINKRKWFVGLVPITVSLGILSYYLVITGWSFAYSVFSFTKYPDFSKFSSSFYPILFFVISLFIVGFTTSKGIKKGIERMATVLMPLFIVLVGSLSIYSLTLPGAHSGLHFYLTANFKYLLNINTWILGFSQAFFSLSIGYGILITYGSYLSDKDNIFKESLGIAIADTLIALVGGLLIFPIVFTFGLNPAAGSELSFISMPAAFTLLPFGKILGFFFFLLLFIAAITSAVSMMEVGISTFVDELKWTRKKSSVLLSIVIFILAIPSLLTYLGKGLFIKGVPFIEFADNLFGSLLLFSAALLCLTVLWGYKPEFSHNHKISNLIYAFLKYLVPAVLIGMLVFKIVA